MGKISKSILALLTVSSVQSDDTFQVTSCNDAEMVNISSTGRGSYMAILGSYFFHSREYNSAL